MTAHAGGAATCGFSAHPRQQQALACDLNEEARFIEESRNGCSIHFAVFNG
jgi:hypothetical protein